MKNLTDNMKPKMLRKYLCGEIRGLKEFLETKQYTKAAFLLRDWASGICNYPQRTILLRHGEYTLSGLLSALQNFEGGVWCGGCGKVMAGILQACMIPAATYGYGFSDVSHVTTLFSPDKGENFYVLDAYLNYHYVYAGSDEMIPLPKILYHIRHRQYDSFERVDTVLKTRHLVTVDQTAKNYAWLFDGNPPADPDMIVGGHRVYDGAHHSVDKVLKEGCPFRLRADVARGGQDLAEYMLDLMLLDPRVGRVNTACTKCYQDRAVLKAFIRGLGNRRE